MVNRILMLAWIVLFASVAAQGQEARVRARVDTQIQPIEKAFRIFVESTGSSVGTPVILEAGRLIQ